jgi:two-component system, OmpR family, sensor kinase
MNGRLGRPTASLFVQVLALVLVSLIIAQLITVLVIFNLPRPDPDVYRLSEVAEVLGGGRPNATPRPLVARIRSGPPRDLYDSVVRTDVERRLAARLGVSANRIAFVPRFRDSPLIRLWPVRPTGRTESERISEQIRRDRLRFVELASADGAPRQAFLLAPFEVGLQLPDGRWRVVEPKPLGLLDPWQQRVVIWFVLTILVMAPLAYWFSRRLAAPISAFAQAAERLGRDPGAPPMALTGSAELGAASIAFNEMQERLRRYVHDRTSMIGAIAHDLRTPLTRLRFRIESAPEEMKAKMASDIDQMEAMVSATLSFVRDASQPRTRTRLELSSLLESVVDEMADVGQAVSLESADKVVIEGDPIGLRRLFANLIDNALKFGDRARARLFVDEKGCATVEIDDDGPGLSPAELDRVFEPFFRTEPSRARHTGGMGLGLAVARSIARAHGGDVVLENRTGRGLRASVRLP